MADTAHSPQSKSDFGAAEEIKGILQGREKAEQERIIRWVTESLNLAILTSPSAVVHPPMQTPPPSTPATPTHHQHVTPPGGGSKNIKTFVDEKQPKNDIQFVAVVAYFHRFEAAEIGRKEVITPLEIQEAARLAGRERFKNPAVPLNNAVKLGYLDRAERGTFKINAVGENLVAMTLPGKTGDGNSSRPRKKRKPTATKPVKKAK